METKEKSKTMHTEKSHKIHGDYLEGMYNAKESSDFVEEKHTKQSHKEDNVEPKNDFWEDAKENVSEGAKLVGEKVNEYAHTISEKAKEAFKSSSEFTIEKMHQAQDIIDQYKHKKEIKQLSDERDTFLTQLGKNLYRTVKNNNHQLPENYISELYIKQLLDEVENIDKKIIAIKEMDEKQEKNGNSQKL